MYQKYNKKAAVSFDTTGTSTSNVASSNGNKSGGLDLTIIQNVAEAPLSTPDSSNNVDHDPLPNASKPCACKYCNGKLFLLIGVILLILTIVAIAEINSDSFCEERDTEDRVTDDAYGDFVWCKMGKVYLTVIIAVVAIVSMASMWCCFKMCT